MSGQGEVPADLLAALRDIDQIHDLGDAIYAVREREAEGWDGPKVTRYSEAVEVVKRYLKANPA